jgi:hypothetical protein
MGLRLATPNESVALPSLILDVVADGGVSVNIGGADMNRAFLALTLFTVSTQAEATVRCLPLLPTRVLHSRQLWMLGMKARYQRFLPGRSDSFPG